jgi:hypothetical protein
MEYSQISLPRNSIPELCSLLSLEDISSWVMSHEGTFMEISYQLQAVYINS